MYIASELNKENILIKKGLEKIVQCDSRNYIYLWDRAYPYTPEI